MKEPVRRVAVLDLLSIVPYYTGYLCRSLNQAGVRAELQSVTYHLDAQWFSSVGVDNRTYALDSTRWFQPKQAWLRRPLKMAEYLLNLAAFAVSLPFTKPDVIHVQFLPLFERGLPLEIWLLRFARGLGIRLVYTVHNFLPHDSGAAAHTRYRQLYELADALIAHDEHGLRRLQEEFGIAAEKVRVIAHGPLFAERPKGGSADERARLGLPDDAIIVACQGILRPYKGIPFLLDAWKKVAPRCPSAVLRIAGTGDDDIVAEIREKVRALQLEASVLLDLRFLTVEEVQRCLDSADVLAYPYVKITTSGALLTGVNFGKAVVATKLPAFELLLTDGENALLVDYGDVDALAAALERLIRDPALRCELGTNLSGAEFRQSGWEEIARQTRRCYEAVLAPKTAGMPLRSAGD
jgi:glycosyltransferase involved in cell wall biosynthesis